MARSGARCMLAILLTLTVALPSPAVEPAPQEFEITFDPAVRAEPFTGRVIIFLSENSRGEPRTEYSWFSEQTFFSTDARDWRPGEPLRIRAPRGFPGDLQDLPAKEYRLQVVMHTNPDLPHSGTARGNLCSKPIRRTLDPAKSGVVKLKIDRRIDDPPPPLPSHRAKVIDFRSPCLSKFHGRDITMHAMVIPPAEYDDEPDRRFPAIYVVPGFGGDHYESGMYSMMLGQSETPFVRIGLDPTTPWGHSVFADSANNGPWGRALVEELIPHLEKEFRLIPEERARYLTGHSSGGWGSLWLQVAYPDFFGGTWSTSPDPVDFHDFCGIPLYTRGTNFYVDADGDERWIMRIGSQFTSVRRFTRMEDTLGPGGQLQSFEAVFSPRGTDGMPRPVFDRRTGEIDRWVVKAWKRYDICAKLYREWPTIGPKLRGKLTIICGTRDNFFLEGSVRRLKKALKELGSEARVILVKNRDHFSLLYSTPLRRIIKEMDEKFRESEKAALRSAAPPWRMLYWGKAAGLPAYGAQPVIYPSTRGACPATGGAVPSYPLRLFPGAMVRRPAA